ncbi:hypothetical protein KIPB_011557, partial [Kipferlia bialata]|eukprot:g11557.t1
MAIPGVTKDTTFEEIGRCIAMQRQKIRAGDERDQHRGMFFRVLKGLMAKPVMVDVPTTLVRISSIMTNVGAVVPFKGALKEVFGIAAMQTCGLVLIAPSCV